MSHRDPTRTVGEAGFTTIVGHANTSLTTPYLNRYPTTDGTPSPSRSTPNSATASA